jgi:hypothetical protein
MTITLEQLGTWFGIATALVGGMWAIGRLLIVQFSKLLDTRFQAQDERFDALVRGQEQERANWQRIERDLLELKADLPVAYVRRDDYVRGQTVIEAKLDAIHTRIENVQIKVAQSQGKQS